MSHCTTYRNITYRVIPGSHSKAQKLAGQAGACRFVWNHFLGRNQEVMEWWRRYPELTAKPKTPFFSLGFEFIKLRKEVDWLRSCCQCDPHARGALTGLRRPRQKAYLCESVVLAAWDTIGRRETIDRALNFIHKNPC